MKHATAKVFMTGRSQAVRIPRAFRFDTVEVLIRRHENGVILLPRPRSWERYFAEATRFSDDFPDHIDDPSAEDRESFV